MANFQTVGPLSSTPSSSRRATSPRASSMAPTLSSRRPSSRPTSTCTRSGCGTSGERSATTTSVHGPRRLLCSTRWCPQASCWSKAGRTPGFHRPSSKWRSFGASHLSAFGLECTRWTCRRVGSDPLSTARAPISPRGTTFRGSAPSLRAYLTWLSARPPRWALTKFGSIFLCTPLILRGTKSTRSPSSPDTPARGGLNVRWVWHGNTATSTRTPSLWPTTRVASFRNRTDSGRASEGGVTLSRPVRAARRGASRLHAYAHSATVQRQRGGAAWGPFDVSCPYF
mmetsp:Transcript_31127/g.81585  ORF Transcript_31127/g.81585 Transcript_31127/m.81585 type:complete len:284 (+) Transcript_31127:703-1554(+)